MRTLQWQTPEELRHLISELVGWDSRTLTDGEIEFAHHLKAKLSELSYFQQNPSHVQLHEADKGRLAVTALYKNEQAKDTIVLISHFDTVHTEEFGDLGDLAFQPEQLTKAFMERKDDLPEEAREDLESGAYLFGRGTMDMKMGLALHMRLIEKASTEQWPINLVLAAVPDEEVNSAGMRAVVPALLQLKEAHKLKYKLFLNGEPSFTQEPGDKNHYIYSGSIGKIMPTALFYGKETHVGEPLSGMTANYIASFLTQRMEWNTLFQESDLGENTPLPVSLQQKDLKMEYSTQTPYRGKALYNVFLMKRDASEIMEIFKQVAEEAAAACNNQYKEMCERENVNPIGEVSVITYEALLQHATEKLGEKAVDAIKQDVVKDEQLDDREKSVRIADSLMLACQELGPAIVLLYAPPYYPAVNASDDSLIIELVDLMKKTAQKEFNTAIKQIHYFNGISDLSYVSYKDTGKGWDVFQKNTPVWGETYEIPFTEMAQLDAPVLNVGPFGKDAHKLTERLHKDSAFVQLPFMLDTLVKSMFPIKEPIIK
ncbi:M20/M25/M40 family metallo-hydrolase [Virgibacillus sp. W0181]|uniref:M20/M25/M40 family metallo-hydrolase n=1 Tax=Virgibacillus sp. W0181 TaxID=3391581 RepID=UPI003F486505